jgi:hypothetical protein
MIHLIPREHQDSTTAPISIVGAEALKTKTMPRMIFSDYRKVPNLRQIIKMIDKPRRLAKKRKSRKISLNLPCRYIYGSIAECTRKPLNPIKRIFNNVPTTVKSNDNLKAPYEVLLRLRLITILLSFRLVESAF